MSLLKVQLNHPGKEKNFKINKGYNLLNNRIIREWNNDSKHYRKLIRCEGEYLSSLNTKPITSQILFWGEWEGHSVFTPIGNGNNTPYGIHEPFHSVINRGRQNTDPYVYGDYFKYATCSQSGKLLSLLPNSLILFGTTNDTGFELDTVFVVKCNESAKNILENNVKNYTKVYFEETILPLGQRYFESKKMLYHGQSWFNNKEYFSFVPCKTEIKKDFQKAVLPIPPFAKQKVGHPFRHFDMIDHLKLWKFVVEQVLKQGFSLGVKFKEPRTNNKLLEALKI